MSEKMMLEIGKLSIFVDDLDQLSNCLRGVEDLNLAKEENPRLGRPSR